MCVCEGEGEGFYEVALLELDETRARRTGRETSDCNSRERLGEP